MCARVLASEIDMRVRALIVVVVGIKSVNREIDSCTSNVVPITHSHTHSLTQSLVYSMSGMESI